MVVLTTSPSLPSSHLRCLAVMDSHSELFTLLSHNDGVIVALYFQVLKPQYELAETISERSEGISERSEPRGCELG